MVIWERALGGYGALRDILMVDSYLEDLRSGLHYVSFVGAHFTASGTIMKNG